MPSPQLPAPPGRTRSDGNRQPFRRTEEATTRRNRSTSTNVAGKLAIAGTAIAVLMVAIAPPAFAGTTAPTLTGVIDNLRNWLMGILATVATLYLTIGGLRYLTAGGDPGQVEKAKTALKSAAVGYALAILAPLLISILGSVVGG